MPTEPDHNMDKPLQSYAAQRREQAGTPAELHPATRRLLQAEVAKLRAAAPASSSTSWLRWVEQFWPRLAAVSVVLVAGVAAVLVFRGGDPLEPPMQLAKKEIADAPAASQPTKEEARKREDFSMEIAAVSAPAAPAPLMLKDETAGAPGLGRAMESREKRLETPVELARTVQLVAPPARLEEAKTSADTSLNAAAPQAFFFKQKAGPTAVSQDGFTRSRFANIPLAGKTIQPALAPVLATFAMEQSGDQLRLVDADGSIYDGVIQLAAPASNLNYLAANLAGQPTLAEADKSDALQLNRRSLAVTIGQAAASTNSSNSSWNFRVTGTNRTLRQSVIVDGVLEGSMLPNATAASKPAGPASQGTVQLQDAKSQFTRDATKAEPEQLSKEAAGFRQNTQGGLPGSVTQGGAYSQSVNILNTRRIQGQVRIGATNRMLLDAVPDSR